MEIKILGPGCPRCEQTEKNVKEAVQESGVDAKVDKVTFFSVCSHLGHPGPKILISIFKSSFL
jgi:hydrogenase maturation factor